MVKKNISNVQVAVFEEENEADDTIIDAENDEDAEVEMPIDISSEIEEIRVLTKLSMNSRKLKINICHELLQELEKHDLNFRLN